MKVDILNNIESYIESGGKIYRVEPEHDPDKIERVYKQKVRYNGPVKDFVGREITFTYRKEIRGELYFYDIKLEQKE